MFGKHPTAYAIGGATSGFGGLVPQGVGHNSGFLNTAGPGRTDNIRIAPDAQSYVIPADVVSALGEGASSAGALALENTLADMAHTSPQGFASLGPPAQKSDVVAAGGEYIISPQQVMLIGGGNMERGHRILDKFVLHVRAENIKTLQKLKGPVKS